MALIIKKAAPPRPTSPTTQPPTGGSLTVSSAPVGDLLDARCRDSVAKNIHCSVGWLMMASYGYYKQDMPILSDGMYDWLAKFIAANWDKIRHPHKRFMDRASLRSTSSLELGDGLGLDTYPNMTRSAYGRLARSIGYRPRVILSFPKEGARYGAGYAL